MDPACPGGNVDCFCWWLIGGGLLLVWSSAWKSSVNVKSECELVDILWSICCCLPFFLFCWTFTKPAWDFQVYAMNYDKILCDGWKLSSNLSWNWGLTSSVVRLSTRCTFLACVGDGLRLIPRRHLGVQCGMWLPAASSDCNANTGHPKVCRLLILVPTEHGEATTGDSSGPDNKTVCDNGVWLMTQSTEGMWCRCNTSSVITSSPCAITKHKWPNFHNRVTSKYSFLCLYNAIPKNRITLVWIQLWAITLGAA